MQVFITGEHEIQFPDALQAGDGEGSLGGGAGDIEEVIDGDLELVGFVEHGMDATGALDDEGAGEIGNHLPAVFDGGGELDGFKDVAGELLADAGGDAFGRREAARPHRGDRYTFERALRGGLASSSMALRGDCSSRSVRTAARSVLTWVGGVERVTSTYPCHRGWLTSSG